MRPQLLITVFGVFIFGTMLAAIASGSWLLGGETNIIRALASFNTVTLQAGGGWGIFQGLITFGNAVATALTWDYPYLSDPWCIFIKIPLWLVSIGVVWGFIELATTAIQGIVGTIRSLIPG